jgi:hypothetical protein
MEIYNVHITKLHNPKSVKVKGLQSDKFPRTCTRTYSTNHTHGEYQQIA